MLNLNGDDIREKIQEQAADTGDAFAKNIYGINSSTWAPSLQEKGKEQNMMVFANGIANAITGSVGSTGDFDKIDVNLINAQTGDFGSLFSNNKQGVTFSGDIITQLDSTGITGGIQYKKRRLGFTNGLLTNPGIESGWIIIN